MLANAPTDPEIRAQMIETVRKWVAREVIPVASELEHADEYPEAIVDATRNRYIEAYERISGLSFANWIGPTA